MEIEVEISSLQMHHLRSDNDSVLIIPSISDVEYILFRLALYPNLMKRRSMGMCKFQMQIWRQRSKWSYLYPDKKSYDDSDIAPELEANKKTGYFSKR